jgi:hypothetical protein
VAALGVKQERAAQYMGRMTCLVGGAIFGYDIGISGNHAPAPTPPCPSSSFISTRVAQIIWPAAASPCRASATGELAAP